jgi:hypothetical protein
VRIRKTPLQHEMDGVQLDRLAPGSVRNFSPSIAAWLIAEGYADPEMRMSHDEPFSSDPRRTHQNRRNSDS